jgi:hypothetical protein
LSFLYLNLELHEQIIDLSEKLAFDLDQEFADQPVLIRIFNEFRMFLYTLCKKHSIRLKPDSMKAFEEYYIWRKKHVMEINKNKRLLLFRFIINYLHLLFNNL